MKIPLQITFRNMEPSDAVEAKIREKAAGLEQYAKDIMSCRVIVEAPHKHHHKGNIYAVIIDVTLPGNEVVVDRNPGQDHAHEDVYVAIRDAFNAVRRQLEDYLRLRRNKVKTHETLPHGAIKELFPEQDYGVIDTQDSRDIYFHRNSVINADFDKLKVGDSVHFSEEMGEEGPQASTVHVEGKHHAAIK
ncbi:HPF/RaiA family ribosome-associated protein [Sulfuriflexus mobilis]|uniref:HPF/RaiA family ribosome-associated protein n=1 Tax=Sulfuriflexus mobilis TaxID=1811807 RepID=UPI000F83B4FE|nr:HPF/RaiA family ribosome-associated protein [Sulfuriflexus mobilis]